MHELGPQNQEFRQQLLSRSPMELIQSGERTKRDETIPLSAIQIDFSLVDNDHAQELSESMGKDWGQISPITVRAREDETSQIAYDIIDGFHRTEAKLRKGDETIDAIVMYGVNDEELFDLRILAVNSVKSVQFARLAEWMKRSFEQTKWHGRITLTQAFSLAVFDAKTTRYEGIANEEVEEIKDWAKGKASTWQRSYKSVWSNLRLIDISDPDLVKDVRTTGGGKDRIRVLSQGMLKEIAENFPGEENFHVQKALARFAISKRLSNVETADMVYLVSGRIDKRLSEQDIFDMLDTVYEEELRREREVKPLDFGGLTEENEEDLYLIEEETDREPTPEELADIEDYDEELMDALLVGDETDSFMATPDVHDEIIGVGKIIGVKRKRNSTDAELRPLIDRIKELENHIRELTRRLESNGANHNFWETAVYLTATERIIMDALFGNIMPFDDVARKFGITPPRLAQIVQGAFVKKFQYKNGANFYLERDSVKRPDTEEDESQDEFVEVELNDGVLSEV